MHHSTIHDIVSQDTIDRAHQGKSVKIALIGARRKKSGIGAYIGDFLHRGGAEVVAVLGTTAHTAREAVEGLARCGIGAAAFTDVYRMMRETQPDAVVIASPAVTHFHYLMAAVTAGLHVLCEKPFIWNETGDLEKDLTRVFAAAERRQVIIAMNSQWPFSLPFYEALCGPLGGQAVSSFFIRLSPPRGGKEMIVEAVPHALSLLYCVCGEGTIHNLAVTHHSDAMTIHFDYVGDARACFAEIRLVCQPQPPRDLAFGFNGKIVTRTIEPVNYDIYFHHRDASLKIQDPLERSVADFLSAVRNGKEPFIGTRHIMHTTRLLAQIYRHCENTL